jgi:tRNA dimethylallyltransferase
MGPQPNQTPLVVLVGETASGKTALSIELAKRFNGEIISADSRAIYRGMDIGTAKPTIEEMDGVPHHLIDVVEPNQPFTVADYKRLVLTAIQDIGRRGRLPIMVGGTGLYVDAVVYNFAFRDQPDQELREGLQQLSVDQLQQIIIDKGLSLPQNQRNPRHLIRTIETNGAIASREHLRNNTLLLGLQIDRETLKEKLAKRVDAMVDGGFIAEVQNIADQYGWEIPAMQAPGYKAFRKYLANDITLEEAKTLFVRNDLQLAKRQRTWFKRDTNINWICKKDEAVDLVTTFLNKVYTAS